MTVDLVTLSVDAPVAWLTLNRPDKRNAIDLGVLDALDAALDAVEADASARVAVLLASGPSFSAGGDIKAWAALDPAQFGYAWIRRGHRTFDRLAQLRVPTIAVVDGDAFGGGLELAACCDFRIAEEQARFGLPEAGLGMVPGWSGTQRLARRFGPQIVRRLAIGGEVLNARSAMGAGVVDAVVETGAGRGAAEAYARGIAARGPSATQAAKAMLAVAEGEAAEANLDLLSGMMIAATDELGEGVAAFLEKRKPDFDAGGGDDD